MYILTEGFPYGSIVLQLNSKKLIKRGGGKGPMKPGNRQMYGANSCRIAYSVLKDGGVISLYATPSSEGVFYL